MLFKLLLLLSIAVTGIRYFIFLYSKYLYIIFIIGFLIINIYFLGFNNEKLKFTLIKKSSLPQQTTDINPQKNTIKTEKNTISLENYFNFKNTASDDWENIKQKEIDDKLSFYQKLNELSPYNQDVLLNLALLSYYNQDYHGFKKYYQELKTINPNRAYLK